MSLLAMQSAFMAAILSEDAPVIDDPRMAAGMAVYRGNYRAALMAAMAQTYPRTRDWVGQAAFERAAAHHILSQPPRHWSIDLAGEGFADSCAVLFANDRDVAELARIEWAMQIAFTAADAPHWTVADFAAATADYDDADWEAMRLMLHPAVSVVPVSYALPDIWNRLADGPAEENAVEPMPTPAACIVHRCDTQAAFIMVDSAEGACLSMAQAGADFAAICAHHAAGRDPEGAPAEVGRMLSHWLTQGWICGVTGAA